MRRNEVASTIINNLQKIIIQEWKRENSSVDKFGNQRRQIVREINDNSTQELSPSKTDTKKANDSNL